MNEKDPIPTTIPELAIHLGYIKSSLRYITEEIKNIGNNFASKEEVGSIKVEVGKNRDKIDMLLGDRKWILGAVCILVALQGIIWFSVKSYISSEINRTLATYNITYGK